MANDNQMSSFDDEISLTDLFLTRAREMNQRNAGELHQALGAPITTGSLLPPRAPLILALAIVLGGFIAVLLALLLPGRKSDAV